jgi:uncharacterized protein (TIGR02145 family)
MKRFLITLCVLSALFSSCKKDKKDEKQVTLPQLSTTAISNLGYNTATSGGTITGNGGGAITASGICWSKTNNTPTLADSKTTGTTASGSFVSVMNSLEENTTYYVRAYATNSAGTGYGSVVTFTTTVNITLPALTTAAITNLGYNTATSGGTITGNGGAAIIASGICWSKNNNPPTIADSIATGTTATGSFVYVMNNLEENTTYYVRAFATNSVGTGYGNVITFTTPVNVTLPVLTTTAITNLAYNTATSGGTITGNGGGTITTSGICWSKTNNPPTLDDSKTTGTTATGSFVSVMNSLEENTTYYVRAYATNSAGTGYGAVVTFTTPLNITVPVLTTAAITNLSHNTATSGGAITGNGGAAITASGICWSKTNNPPTIADSKTTGTTATGSFVSVMNSLESATTYYVRAYATNSAGTGYGAVVSFTTPAITVPVLTTAAITGLSHNTATSGGTITGNGGAAITASGICWSKTNNPPTLSDSKTTGTTATGSFVSVMNSLEAATTYYVRAYATNSAGTGYGAVVTFTTTADANSVTFTYNGASVTYGVITSPVTGKKWLDRNLGASQVATAFNDRMAYGHLFQWGRPADGHQLVTYSSSTIGSGVNGKTKTLAMTDAPGHSTFITPDNTVEQNGVFVYDWRDNQNTNRWAINSQGSCPSGWHIPTRAEWDAETGITNSASAFTQLKLTVAGYRYGDFDGSGREGTVRTAGSFGYYWSSSVWPSGAGVSVYKDIASNDSFTDQLGRAYGLPIRCIKD